MKTVAGLDELPSVASNATWRRSVPRSSPSLSRLCASTTCSKRTRGGKDRWVERLHETCPPAHRPTVVLAVQLALLWAYEAVYDLHTTALRLELLQTTQRAVIAIDLERDERLAQERLEQAIPSNRVRGRFWLRSDA